MRQELATTLPSAGAFTIPETFLTETQLAELLKVSKRSVQRWRVEGRGPRFRRHGAAVRYALTDALAWSEANAAHSTSEQAA